MKKLIIILSFLLINASVYSNNNIEVAVDLGGKKFHYLEILFAKVIIKNNSMQMLEVEKGEIYEGPYVEFEIFDKQSNKILPNNWPVGNSFVEKKTIYKIEPGKEVEFPLGQYYNLQYFMFYSEPFRYQYLKPGKYKVRCTGMIKGNRIKSDWSDIEVTNDHYAGLKQFGNINNKYRDLYRNFKGIEKEYYQILEYDSTSILSLRVMLNFPYLYHYFYDASKEYIYRKEILLLKKAKKIFFNYYPESRFAYYVVERINGYLSRKYLEEYALDQTKLQEDLLKDVKIRNLENC